MADMLLCYGYTHGCGRAAARLYRRRYPTRRQPNHQIFGSLYRRLRETGSLLPRNSDRGRPRTRRTANVEEEILNGVGRSPRISTRRLGAEYHVSHMTAWRILHEQLLYPYHPQRVQGITPADCAPRRAYCNWLLERAEDPTFISKILFTDEATFGRTTLTNIHNEHIWADENPHARTVRSHQRQFRCNVWLGIIGDHLLGPYHLPHRLTGDRYMMFLETTLADAVDDLPLAVSMGMWFMHDGAPAHYSHNVRAFLDTQYPGRWIGRAGPVLWPARSPDLTPLDFYCWGHMKVLVYATDIPDIECLHQRIADACETIRNTNGIFNRVRESMVRRARACIDADGGHFEHLL